MTKTELSTLKVDQKRVLLQQLLRERERTDRKTPLSFSQRRLWFFDKLEPESPLYNIPTVLRLAGPLSYLDFQASLSEVAARHESLRTTFEANGDDPVQRVHPPANPDLPVIDLSRLGPAERESELELRVEEEICRPFDLSKDSMLRASLIRLGIDEHILVLVLHHIASDEWSMRVLFEEWAALYRARLEGTASCLSALPLQYRDFAKTQIEWVRSGDYRRQLEYWREQLRSAGTLQLAGDYPPPSGQTFRGAVASDSLPRSELKRLEELSRREGVTLFMLLLAVFKALLFRYTQQSDVVVGCPIAGRSHPECEHLIGFFVNMLPLRTQMRPDGSFRELLRQVRETTLGAFAHQEIPFDKLVEELHPDRSSVRTPFIQAAFALNRDWIPRQLFPQLSCEEIDCDTGTAKFDLTLVARERPDGLQLLVEYNTDLFAPERIGRLLAHYRELLSSVLRDPAERVSRINLLTKAERSLLLGTASRSEYPREESVPKLFEAVVARNPDATALDYDGVMLTYRELNARANQLAHFLVKREIGAGTLVGVHMERSVEMIVALLGILKAGAAYVPLDLSYPGDRLAFMMHDARMPVVLTQSAHLSTLPTGVTSVICLDSDWDRIAREPRSIPRNPTHGESLAYVIYTSGSTGKPKGVAIPHRGITRLVLQTDYVRLNPEDSVAQASNASFDAATFEIWGALLNGARLVGISKEVALSPEGFARRLREERISILFLTTALFNQLAREVPGIFSPLKTVLFGGEAVDPQWVRAVLAGGPPQRLLHVYGPTENTTFSSWHLIEEVSEEALTIPIGTPISNSEWFILDPCLNPVPIGVQGEIYVGGDGLACGYWNQPDLTRERFIPHPFSNDPSARLYRTGDLARFDSRLRVEFIGRIDQQVKLRGLRIELGEIEAQLLRHPSISQAVVMLREDVPGDKRLAAYLVPRHSQPDLDELRQFLRNQLPAYMIPSAFVFLPALPLTPNEKVDRRALPIPDQNRPSQARSFVAPRDSFEQQLAKIFEKVLGIQPIGVGDNFFDLGGHSLLAVRVFSQIEKIFHRKLPLATLFKAPTIEKLARVLREDNQAKSWSTLVDIQPRGSRPPFFWLHTLGGDGGGGFFYYRKLAELLGPDQPSFGIRSPREPFSRIEEMARFYIKEIQKFQPNGPYYLGGFCFGGNVAFEMARQLTAEGEKIGLLVLLESSPPNIDSRRSWSAASARYSIENIVENLKDFVSNSPQGRLVALKSKGRRLKQRLQRTVEIDDKPVELKDVIDLSAYPEGYVTYAETHWEALTHYHPQAYSGEITLFRAKKQGLSNFSHALGWDVLAGDRVHVNVIPGTHENMLQEPNVQIVAAKLRQLLAAAQRTQPSSQPLQMA